MAVNAPAVIKLLGEHAVVYGKTSLAVAINMYASASLLDSNRDVFTIELRDLEKCLEFDKNSLREVYENYKRRLDINSYIDKYFANYNDALPYATIASRLFVEFGIPITGKKVVITSKIPMQKGFASSAACCTAFTVALIRNSNLKLKDEEIIDIARDGDRIIHRNEGAGKIDVNTSFYGGFVRFSSETGIKKIKPKISINILLIDTGPKKSTAETVEHVSYQYKTNRENTEKILDEIDKCSKDGIDAIMKGDVRAFGKCMSDDHELLRKLGVSSKGLDKVVEYAKVAEAYGAKLSGGGGGGLAIAIDNENSSLEKMLLSKNIAFSKAKVSDIGASSYLSK